MMTRRDYVKIALILRTQLVEAQAYAEEVRGADGVQAVETIARDLAVAFAEDNERFDSAQFLMSSIGKER